VPFDLVFPNAVLTALQAAWLVSQQLDQDADLEVIDYIANSTGTSRSRYRSFERGRLLSTPRFNGENGRARRNCRAG